MDHPTIHPSIHPSVHIDWNRAYHFNTFDLVLRAASFIAARYIARQQSAIFCICVLVNEYYELARVFGCWNLGRLVRHQNASPREFETINTFGYATSCFIHTYEYGYIYANTSWWCRLASLSSWCAICWPTMVAAGQHFAYILSARTGFVANNSHLTIVWWTTITTHTHKDMMINTARRRKLYNAGRHISFNIHQDNVVKVDFGGIRKRDVQKNIINMHIPYMCLWP